MFFQNIFNFLNKSFLVLIYFIIYLDYIPNTPKIFLIFKTIILLYFLDNHKNCFKIYKTIEFFKYSYILEL